MYSFGDKLRIFGLPLGPPSGEHKGKITEITDSNNFQHLLEQGYQLKLKALDVLNQTCQGHARQNQDMAEHPHRFKPALSSTEAQNRRYFENPWNTLKFT